MGQQQGPATLDELWFEAQHIVRSRVRHAIREGLASPVGGAGLHILQHVLKAGPVSPSELADRLDIRSSTMTAHLDRLEEAGWLRRHPVPGSPSRVQVTATPAGEETYRRYLELRGDVVERFLEPLGTEDRDVLARALTRALERARNAHRHRRGDRRSEHPERSHRGGS